MTKSDRRIELAEITRWLVLRDLYTFGKDDWVMFRFLDSEHNSKS